MSTNFNTNNIDLHVNFSTIAKIPNPLFLSKAFKTGYHIKTSTGYEDISKFYSLNTTFDANNYYNTGFNTLYEKSGVKNQYDLSYFFLSIPIIITSNFERSNDGKTFHIYNNTTFTVLFPCTCYVLCAGGGAAGGANLSVAEGGGGGGATTFSVVQFYPDVLYTATIAAQSTGNGNNTTLTSDNSTINISASGGSMPIDASGGLGGDVVSCISSGSNIIFSNFYNGGSGGNGQNSTSAILGGGGITLTSNTTNENNIQLPLTMYNNINTLEPGLTIIGKGGNGSNRNENVGNANDTIKSGTGGRGAARVTGTILSGNGGKGFMIIHVIDLIPVRPSIEFFGNNFVYGNTTYLNSSTVTRSMSNKIIPNNSKYIKNTGTKGTLYEFVSNASFKTTESTNCYVLCVGPGSSGTSAYPTVPKTINFSIDQTIDICGNPFTGGLNAYIDRTSTINIDGINTRNLKTRAYNRSGFLETTTFKGITTIFNETYIVGTTNISLDSSNNQYIKESYTDGDINMSNIININTSIVTSYTTYNSNGNRSNANLSVILKNYVTTNVSISGNNAVKCMNHPDRAVYGYDIYADVIKSNTVVYNGIYSVLNASVKDTFTNVTIDSIDKVFDPTISGGAGGAGIYAYVQLTPNTTYHIEIDNGDYDPIIGTTRQGHTILRSEDGSMHLLANGGNKSLRYVEEFPVYGGTYSIKGIADINVSAYDGGTSSYNPTYTLGTGNSLTSGYTFNKIHSSDSMHNEFSDLVKTSNKIYASYYNNVRNGYVSKSEYLFTYASPNTFGFGGGGCVETRNWGVVPNYYKIIGFGGTGGRFNNNGIKATLPGMGGIKIIYGSIGTGYGTGGGSSVSRSLDSTPADGGKGGEGVVYLYLNPTL